MVPVTFLYNLFLIPVSFLIPVKWYYAIIMVIQINCNYFSGIYLTK
jgi:hypothetical protein